MNKRFLMVMVAALVLILPALVGANGALAAGKAKIALLMVSEIRKAPVDGFKDGLAEMGMAVGKGVELKIFNADGDRNKLTGLAKRIIASRPDVAIAAGGIEADALRVPARAAECR